MSGTRSNHLTPAQRIERQFRETTPAGRVFLFGFYALAFSALTWLVFHYKPKTLPYFATLGSWLREIMGTTGGNVALFALVAVPLAALLYFAFRRQRD